MSQENVDLARARYERWNAGEFEAWIEAFDPEAEYLSSVTAAIDGRGEYRGHDGIRQFLRDYMVDWESFHLAPTEYLDAGSKVVVVMRVIARGRESGVRVDRQLAHVWTFRGAKATRHQSFATREEALQAAGLSE